MAERNILTSYFLRRITSASRGRYAASLVGILPDGRELVSGPIVSIDGRTVTTRSGSAYELSGEPRWIGEGYDDANPLMGEGVSFYLDTDGAQTWPPGAEVPVLGARHWREG